MLPVCMNRLGKVGGGTSGASTMSGNGVAIEVDGGVASNSSGNIEVESCGSVRVLSVPLSEEDSTV